MLRTQSILGVLPIAGVLVCACSANGGSSGETTEHAALALASGDVVEARPSFGPPEEAFAACSDLTEGASCRVSLRGRTLDGTCRTGPGDNAILACAPPHPPPHRPPEKAFAACSGLTEAAPCQVSFHDRTVDGTCRGGPGDKAELACAPPHPPRRPPPEEAFAACADLSEGASCRVSFHERTLEGTCRQGPEGTAPLACLPERSHVPHECPEANR